MKIARLVDSSEQSHGRILFGLGGVGLGGVGEGELDG
jgi:hypothetical protein